MVELCDRCWNQLANGLATAEGATATPDPDLDPDGITWIEPPACTKCHHQVRRYPTYYDRWVDLATCELPAKDVPEPYRWRLAKGTGPYVGTMVAVQVRQIEPLPSDLVIPAHSLLCPDEEAERQDLSR